MFKSPAPLRSVLICLGISLVLMGCDSSSSGDQAQNAPAQPASQGNSTSSNSKAPAATPDQAPTMSSEERNRLNELCVQVGALQVDVQNVQDRRQEKEDEISGVDQKIKDVNQKIDDLTSPSHDGLPLPGEMQKLTDQKDGLEGDKQDLENELSDPYYDVEVSKERLRIAQEACNKLYRATAAKKEKPTPPPKKIEPKTLNMPLGEPATPAKASVYNISGHCVPTTQFKAETGPGCSYQHYHASNGKSVTATDGVVIPDSNTEKDHCGYGKVGSLSSVCP